MDGAMAAEIVVNCVKDVGGHKKVSEDQALNEAGIGSSGLVLGLIDKITNNENIGVPSAGFEISPNVFNNIDSSSLVSDVSDIVAEQASRKVE
jgi:hypothetical protein